MVFFTSLFRQKNIGPSHLTMRRADIRLIQLSARYAPNLVKTGRTGAQTGLMSLSPPSV